MPRAYWTAKRERQYQHIKRSCTKSKKVCSRIAAATVNASRRAAGELKENIMAKARKRAKKHCPKGFKPAKGGRCCKQVGRGKRRHPVCKKRR